MPQALDRVTGLALHRLADAVGDGVEPIVEDAAELGLPPAQRIAHRMQAADRLRLDAGERLDALIRPGRPPGLGGGLAAALARRPHQRDDQPDEDDEPHDRAGDQGLREGHGHIAEREDGFAHAARVS